MNKQYTLEFETPNVDSYYVDQTMYSTSISFSAYTPYGIKCIDSQYIFLIMNMHQCGTLYTIERNREKYIDWRGIECVSPGKYIETYKPVTPEYKSRYAGFGFRVVYDNGIYKDFFYGKGPMFDPETRKINIQQLIYDIKDDVHLHVKIKENLLENIKNYEEYCY